MITEIFSSLMYCLDAPDSVYIVRPTDTDVYSEDDIVDPILCSAQGSPAPSFYWTLNNDVVAEGDLLKFHDPIHRSQIKIIFNKLTNIFFRSDAGEYLCHAANKHGEQTISVVVNVLHRPQCNILIFAQDSLQIFYFRFCQFQSGGRGDCVAVRGLCLS